MAFDVLLLTALASTASPSVDGLVKLRGAEYVRVRDALLSKGALPAPAVEVERDNWRRVVLQEALLAYEADPGLVERTRDLPGLRERVYSRDRRPDPSATRDVAMWPAEVVLEQLAFVDGLDDDTLTGEERFALRYAVVRAAGRGGHPAARFALEEMLARVDEPIRLRCAAAEALGATGAPEAIGVLSAVLGDAHAPVTLRESAIAGLGGLRFEESVSLLASWLDPERGSSARVAVTALARLGSARFADQELRALVAELLVRALMDPWHDVRLVVEALGRVADEESTAKLAAYAVDDKNPAELRARAGRAVGRVQRALRRRGRARAAVSGSRP